ncbi:hypothetical protein MMC13_008399 [Lambiella insularis]|nr:hypothetical protein [Lambiella insularis]
MSGYGKPRYPASKDNESSQPSSDPMYLAYAQPGFAQPPVLSSSSPYQRQLNEARYATNAVYQPNLPFEESALSFTPLRSRQIQLPDVTSFAPQQGQQGTKIFVNLVSVHDVETISAFTFHAMFATRACPSTVTKLCGQGAYRQYLLTFDAPSFSSTGWTSPLIPLRIQIQDEAGLDLGLKDVGLFTYADLIQQAPEQSPQDSSRKRKFSTESLEANRVPTKRTSTQQLRQGSDDLYGAQAYLQQPGTGYMQQTPLEAESPVTNLMSAYNRSTSQGGYQQQESPRRVSHHLSTSSGSTLSQMRVPSPQTPLWSPSTVIASHPTKSPNLSAPSISRVPSASSPGKTNPLLIRTSTLQQSPSPGTTPAGSTTTATFNPYTMYPHKAILKIHGDLDGMAEDWTEDEFDSKRRLVRFWRSQSGSTINTNFKPVTPEARQPNSICISCIWWEDKKECYVTSVDTIYLLESLVAVRFTVEEKNRIRRNLEGFRPMTVSKGKPDSEDFFKLIMGFPNPKPRNIEKDVKVFPWKILTHALKKIIGKYSASNSSTASAIPTSVGPSYGCATQADVGTDLQSTASPRSGSASTYAADSGMTRISPNTVHGRLSVPFPSAGSGMLQVGHPSIGSYTYQGQSQAGGSSGVISMIDPMHRTSWDVLPYIESNAGSANQALHSMYYPPRTTTNQEASSIGYQMTHTSSGP